MKKQNLILATALASVALFAVAASAADFDPIADADFLGDGLHLIPETGRSIELSDGPGSDAEWGDDSNVTAEGTPVDVAWDPITDADYLGTTGAPSSCTLEEADIAQR